jgi:hypothetical protein
MKESDWKLFKNVKENALEKYCAEALSDIDEAMNKEGDSFHSKYLNVYKLINNADDKLSLLFDGHSRSKAAFQLRHMRSEGLVADSELEGMSEGFVKSTAPRE